MLKMCAYYYSLCFPKQCLKEVNKEEKYTTDTCQCQENREQAINKNRVICLILPKDYWKKPNLGMSDWGKKRQNMLLNKDK